MKKSIYYCDMDGVLADFYGVKDCLARFSTEKDFFKMLPPIKENINAIKKLIANGEKVKILSASPNENADHAKRVWLKRHLPEVKRNDIIIVRLGESKIDKVRKSVRRLAILFDDYGDNLEKWLDGGGGAAIKVLGNNERKENRKYIQVKSISEWVKN